MENTQSDSIKNQNAQAYDDIRQSPKWAKFLELLDWESFRTKSGINIEIRHDRTGILAKIQRPLNITKEDLQEILDICKKQKVKVIKIEPGFKQDVTIFEENKFIKSFVPLAPPSTMYINLKLSNEQLWNNLSHSGKYSVRRAQREQTRVEIIQKPSTPVVEIFNKIEAETAKKQGFHTLKREQMLEKAKIFGDECFIAFSYDKNNELCGAYMYLAYKNNLWYMHGGTTETGRKNKSGYELYWQTFLYFKDKGFNLLDLEGIDDPRFPSHTGNWGGFSHFKEKFGGTVVRFPHSYVRYNSLGLKIMSKFLKIPV